MWIPAHDQVSAQVLFVVRVLLFIDYALWTVLGPVIRRIADIILFIWLRALWGKEYPAEDVSKLAQRMWYFTGTIGILVVIVM